MRRHPILPSVPALVVAGLALGAGASAPVYDVRQLSGRDSPGLPEPRREPEKKQEPTP